MVVTIQIRVLLSLLVLFTSVNAIEIRCPDNEEYHECGSACQENCTNIPGLCTYQCVAGCFCKQGFVRETDANSKCLLRSRCFCSINEFFNDCGSACPDNCASKSLSCTKQCVRGCFCMNGFIRLNNRIDSPCIPETECQNTLCYDSNAEYSKCGSLCPRTCHDEHNPVRNLTICRVLCRPGCFCKHGFVLDENSRCIKSEDC